MKNGQEFGDGRNRAERLITRPEKGAREGPRLEDLQEQACTIPFVRWLLYSTLTPSISLNRSGVWHVPIAPAVGRTERSATIQWKHTGPVRPLLTLVIRKQMCTQGSMSTTGRSDHWPPQELALFQGSKKEGEWHLECDVVLAGRLITLSENSGVRVRLFK